MTFIYIVNFDIENINKMNLMIILMNRSEIGSRVVRKICFWVFIQHICTCTTIKECSKRKNGHIVVWFDLLLPYYLVYLIKVPSVLTCKWCIPWDLPHLIVV